MSAHVVMILLNEFGKRDRMRGLRVLVQPRKTGKSPDMTEKLLMLTGM